MFMTWLMNVELWELVSLKSIRQIGSLEIYVGVDGAVWIWESTPDLYVVIFYAKLLLPWETLSFCS